MLSVSLCWTKRSAPRSDRRAYRQLVAPSRIAGQHKVRRIGAGNQKYRQRRHQQKPGSPPGVMDLQVANGANLELQHLAKRRRRRLYKGTK